MRSISKLPFPENQFPISIQTMNSRNSRSIRYSLTVIGLFGIVIPTIACGPWFPDSLLQIAYSAIRPPIPSLEIELERIELDVTLPGKLSIPSRVPMRPHLNTQRLEIEQLDTATALEKLSELPMADLIQNKNECRTGLLASTSEIARDVADLAQILQNRTKEKAGTDNKENADLLQDYYEIRKTMFEKSADTEIKKKISARNWPKGLPPEFVDYLNGASDFREKKYAAARKHFEAILDRPLEERRHRSTIAAYMLGRIALKDGDPEFKKSIPHFRRVLALREEGCTDIFRVGWDALQCVADNEIKFGGNPNLGKRYYFALARTGHRYTLRQLKTIIRKSDLSEAAQDPFLRKVTTAVLFGSSSQTLEWNPNEAKPDTNQEQWLTALENAKVQDSEACRLAWMAYLGGDFTSAKRWLKRAETLDASGHWVQAKLDLQAGKIPAAQQALNKAMPEFSTDLGANSTHPTSLPHPTDQGWPMFSHETFREYRSSQYWGDQGLVKLANNDFIGALDAFYRSGYWYETAYVAEELLSRDELLTWVLKNCPENDYLEQIDGAPAYLHGEKSTISAKLRYLTARRLARDHYFKNAAPLLPKSLRPIFSHYVKGYRALRNTELSEEERISKGWKTAQIHRKLGMELFGTELEPDWFCRFQGDFDGYEYTESRLNQKIESKIDPDFNDHFRNPYWKKLFAEALEPVDSNYWRPIKNGEQLLATNDERWRHRNYAMLPNSHRFHYRHVAADLAWEVAQLMPGESRETARVLAISGKWLSVRTPQPSVMFFRSLVNRNRSTELGHEADMHNWFPDVKWNFDPWKSVGISRPEAFKDW